MQTPAVPVDLISGQAFGRNFTLPPRQPLLLKAGPPSTAPDSTPLGPPGAFLEDPD